MCVCTWVRSYLASVTRLLRGALGYHDALCCRYGRASALENSAIKVPRSHTSLPLDHTLRSPDASEVKYFPPQANLTPCIPGHAALSAGMAITHQDLHCIRSILAHVQLHPVGCRSAPGFAYRRSLYFGPHRSRRRVAYLVQLLRLARTEPKLPMQDSIPSPRSSGVLEGASTAPSRRTTLAPTGSAALWFAAAARSKSHFLLRIDGIWRGESHDTSLLYVIPYTDDELMALDHLP